MALELKPFAYLEVDEVMEFLRIPEAKRTEYRNRVILLINMACQKVEDFIDGPVLARQYTEFRDGTASNVLVPVYGPVKEIVEIKIDFNRAFDIASALTEGDNYVLRGIPNLNQQANSGPVNSVDLTDLYEVDGTDIVIRDDNNMALLGRLFTGSVIQSIKLTYRAGLARDKNDVPDTVKYATLLICDHFYMAQENRDLHLKSKTNNNQSYTKKDNMKSHSALPEEITDLLQDYKDYSFGPYEVPQRNTFQV